MVRHCFLRQEVVALVVRQVRHDAMRYGSVHTEISRDETPYKGHEGAESVPRIDGAVAREAETGGSGSPALISGEAGFAGT